MDGIIDTLQDRGDCNQFLKAMNETNYFEIINGKGPYTVFAPVDEAFSNFSEEDLAKLFENKSRLADMISEHVVVGLYETGDLEKTDEVVNLNNRGLATELHGEGLIVGGAKITESDIRCTDGIIQIVDLVLLP